METACCLFSLHLRTEEDHVEGGAVERDEATLEREAKHSVPPLEVRTVACRGRLLPPGVHIASTRSAIRRCTMGSASGAPLRAPRRQHKSINGGDYLYSPTTFSLRVRAQHSSHRDEDRVEDGAVERDEATLEREAAVEAHRPALREEHARLVQDEPGRVGGLQPLLERVKGEGGHLRRARRRGHQGSGARAGVGLAREQSRVSRGELGMPRVRVGRGAGGRGGAPAQARQAGVRGWWRAGRRACTKTPARPPQRKCFQ